MRAVLVSGRYALTNAMSIVFIGALAHGGRWLIWAAITSSVVIVTAIDEAVDGDRGRLDHCGRVFLDANLYATLPLLAIVTYLMLGTVGSRGAVIAAVIGAGILYAMAGGTVAHEFTHRVTSPLALVWARALLAFTINPTFEAYHVIGHHRNVGTYGDPATARRGEYVLAFVVRTVVEQSIAGWRLEGERLHRKGLEVWSRYNRNLGGILCSIAILACAGVLAGIAGLIAFLAAALFGRALHEMINYVQHYGIVRAEGTPIAARHAWDCCHLLSNALHYNLPRHADHHRFAQKPFWELDVAEDSPKLPYGYLMMSMIALIPSWWHKVIDPLLADWDSRLANDAERSLVIERGWATNMPAHTHNASQRSIKKLDENADKRRAS